MNCPDCETDIIELPGTNRIRAKMVINGEKQRHEIEVEDVLYCDNCGWYQVVRIPQQERASTPRKSIQPHKPQIMGPAEVGQKIAQAAQSAGTFLGQMAQLAESQVKMLQQVAAAPVAAFGNVSAARSPLKQGENGTFEFSYGTNENMPVVTFKQAAPETWCVEIAFGSGIFNGYGKNPEQAMKNAYTSLRSWLTGIVHIVTKKSGVVE